MERQGAAAETHEMGRGVSIRGSALLSDPQGEEQQHRESTTCKTGHLSCRRFKEADSLSASRSLTREDPSTNERYGIPGTQLPNSPDTRHRSSSVGESSPSPNWQ